MKRMRVLVAFSVTVFAVLAFAVASARADVYMKGKVHTGAFQMMGQSQPAKDEIQTFWLGPNKARTDQEAARTSTILLADRKVLIMIDHAKKQYSEMPLDFDKMMAEAAGAAAGQDAEKAKAMENMPESVRNMMKGMMGGMSAKVTETGETKTIGSWNCRKYLIEMNMCMAGTMTSEAWATEDLKVDTSMAFTAASAMMASMPGFENILREMKKIKGVVAYQTTTAKMMGADVTTTNELLECSEKPAPAGTYDIPAGYTKVKAIKG